MKIEPSGPVDFDVRVPGSKSLTNRALICAALAEGVSRLEGASFSDDSRRLVECFRRAGIGVAEGPELLEVSGTGGVPASRGEFYVGNAGTAMRFLTAFLALGEGHYTIDGDERMRERPIGDLVDALVSLGCRIRYGAKPGCPPLLLDARGLDGGRVRVKGDTSSQFVSALLLVSPRARGPIELEIVNPVSEPYIEMTKAVMKAFGNRPCTYRVEADAASANYFLAAAAATRGRAIVRGIGRDTVQGEIRFVDVLARMGCRVEVGGDFHEVRGGDLHGVDVDMNATPDSVQTLAAISIFARGATRIRNVANLRVKETDRIAALATELRKLGAKVDEFPDGLAIEPGPLRPASIATYRDHRMAMSFAIAALAAPGLSIEDPGCVSKSFPDFFDVLAGQGVRWA